MRRIAVLIRAIGQVEDDFDSEQLEECLYNNIMLDIEGFEVEDTAFLVRELEDEE